MLSVKKMLYKMLGMFTPQEYTGYQFSAYTPTDTLQNHVYIIGKLCVFSLSMTYTSNYTPTNTQPFIRNMPKPKAPIMMQGITYSNVTSDSSSFRSFRYRINTDGEFQNWHSGLKTIANNPTIFSGVYVIA